MLVFKKSTILCIILVTILAIILAIFSEKTVSYIASTKPYTIVVDAGHGGIDGGVTGVRTKVKESDLNLAISKKLALQLRDNNFNVVLTRKTADGLYGISSQGFKKRDMLKRKEIILNNSPDIVVSIHQNTFKDSSRRGVQVFYSDNGNNNTKKLASYMQNYLNNRINLPQMNRGYLAQNGDFYIVKCSKAMSIIIECGFLSNELDEKLLITESYQQKLANIISNGIVGFLSNLAEENLT